jgi:hypothetical protein
MDWTANRLPMWQPLSQMPSKSYTGSSAASIDVSDATTDVRIDPGVSSLGLDYWRNIALVAEI